MNSITPTIEQIYKHGSVRQYLPDPVDSELVEAVVAAGQRGSTSSNLQTYSVVVVTDQQTRENLAGLCSHQKQILQAPVFLAWCADFSRLARAAQTQGREIVTDQLENFLVAAMDATIAMQTAALAAESLGLGMCFIGALRNDPEKVVALLNLPPLVFPVSGMTLGWPVQAPKIRPRLPLSGIMHQENYDPAGESEALAQYDREMIATGIYQGRQVGDQQGDTAAYGWVEHSLRRVSKPARPGLRAALANQGFLLK